MSINKTSLEENLAAEFAAVTTSTKISEVYSLVDALATITDDVSFYVNSASDLPDLAVAKIPDGQIVFVKSINQHVVSWRTKWMSIDGRVYRDDSNVNTIWGWGYNGQGRLGDETTVSKSSPVSVVGGFTDWCQVSAGGHSLAIRTNGTLWAWGNNSQGKLGDNTTVSKSSPVSVVGGFTDWCQVSAGMYSTTAVRTNGTLWSWGINSNGVLGDNTVNAKSSPVSVVGGFTDWCQVSVSSTNALALRANGTLWAWGDNTNGRLGDGTTVAKSSPVSVVGGFTDWCQVSAGGRHSVSVRANGTLWAWGYNLSGRLGNNSTIQTSSPVSVVGGFTDWCNAGAGYRHTVAIRTNGTLWAWGDNSDGQLGDNTLVAKSSPVSVVGGFTDWCNAGAGCHTAAVRTNGTIWSWGMNSFANLGDNTGINRSSPVSVVGSFTDWCQVSVGRIHTMAIRTT